MQPKLAGYTKTCNIYTLEARVRTNIEIDDRLMKEAMKQSGAATKKATVEAALRLLVKTHSQIGIRRLRGKIQWEGNLSESRLGRVRQ